ncbi:MAG: VOC family protein [bacterium]
MKLSFDHVHIICNDVEKMKDYFLNVFDGSLEFLDENFHGAPNAIVKVGEAKLFLRGVRPSESPGKNDPDSVMGVDHFSFSVEDVTELSKSLKNKGAEFIREPAAVGMGGRVTAFIRGPEDIRIELSEKDKS